ncbi:MAG: hypothetical protein ACQCXQ_07505 [Verrucomicrobiales bacterium]|nr:hypothetical protein [Verrucomicrobiota bacterium JB025]
MFSDVPHINLTASWIGIALGILSGMLLGTGFLNDKFLGGYASPRRRLYRLAHISFFGLAMINFIFWLTVRLESLGAPVISHASAAFLIGAATMPLSCILTASFPKAERLFAIPVLALSFGTGAVISQLIQSS